MRTQLFCAVLVSAMAALSQAFPTGSPICNSNATAVQAAKQMGTLQADLGFTLDTSSFPGGKYTPGKQYKVTVKGTQQFTGILLYAVNADKTSHPGTFAIANGYKAVVPQGGAPCPGVPDGTLTQTDGTPKGPNVDFLWTAPTTNAGALNFLGIAVTGGKGFQLLKTTNAVTTTGGTTTNTTTGNTTTTGNSTNTGNTTMNGGAGYGSGSGSGAGGSGNSTSPTDTNTTPTGGANAQGSPTSGAGVLVANNALLLTQFFLGVIGAYLFGFSQI